MAESVIKKTWNYEIKYINVTIEGTFTDDKLVQALRNNNDIVRDRVYAYNAGVSGGARIGFCYLYGDTKQYGWVLVGHYQNAPYYLNVVNGVVTPRGMRQYSLTLNNTYCEVWGEQQLIIHGVIGFFHIAFQAKIDIPVLTTIATLPSDYSYRSYENIAVITKNGLVRTFQIRDRNLQNSLVISQGDVVQLSGVVPIY